MERDEHGHIRFAEVDLARKVKAEVQGRLSERGIRVTITNKNIGYELRCARSDSASMRRTAANSAIRAIRFLRDGGSGAMVSIQDGRLIPISFDDMREPAPAGRGCDSRFASEGYRVAREYMIRLEAEDFEHRRPGSISLPTPPTSRRQRVAPRFDHLWPDAERTWPWQ